MQGINKIAPTPVGMMDRETDCFSLAGNVTWAPAYQHKQLLQPVAGAGERFVIGATYRKHLAKVRRHVLGGMRLRRLICAVRFSRCQPTGYGH
jgi:hypothetical protein